MGVFRHVGRGVGSVLECGGRCGEKCAGMEKCVGMWGEGKERCEERCGEMWGSVLG